MNDYKVLIGDCINQMKTLDDNSINCCVTSPPYYGLRDYGSDGQLGLEDSPEEFVKNLVMVFREVKRLLKDDGTLWLNLGDSYAGNNSRASKGRAGLGEPREKVVSRTGEGLKTKDLIGIPWRVALALQADGWYLRQDIIWHKPNAMPESVKDRCTKAHEYIFLLSKSKNYYFDNESIKEPCNEESVNDFLNRKALNNKGGESGTYGEIRKDLCRDRSAYMPDNFKKNKRSVWTVTTKPYKGAHFATFPPDLIEPCILAGCPKGGVVLDPFGGSGTTAGVAIKNDRKAILCELSNEYAQLIPERVRSIVGLQNLELFDD